MGYRDTWINNKGDVVCHFEDTVQAFDKYAPTEPVHMLIRSAGAHVWNDVLPVGSVIDTEPFGDKYDIVIDPLTPADSWVWLISGGLMFIENPHPDLVQILMYNISKDTDSWLPTEEIMSVRVFPHLLIVEKRNPRVIEYMNLYTGVGDHAVMIKSGAKLLTVQ